MERALQTADNLICGLLCDYDNYIEFIGRRIEFFRNNYVGEQ